MEKLLGMKEASEICGIPLRTWQSHYQVWGVPHFRIGRSVKFKLTELNNWVETKRSVVV